MLYIIHIVLVHKSTIMVTMVCIMHIHSRQVQSKVYIYILHIIYYTMCYIATSTAPAPAPATPSYTTTKSRLLLSCIASIAT